MSRRNNDGPFAVLRRQTMNKKAQPIGVTVGRVATAAGLACLLTAENFYIRNSRIHILALKWTWQKEDQRRANAICALCRRAACRYAIGSIVLYLRRRAFALFTNCPFYLHQKYFQRGYMIPLLLMPSIGSAVDGFSQRKWHSTNWIIFTCENTVEHRIRTSGALTAWK